MRSNPGSPLADLEPLLSRRARQVVPDLSSMAWTTWEAISFAFGFPDPASLPAEEVCAATTRVARRARSGGTAIRRLRRLFRSDRRFDGETRAGSRDQARRENILITAGGSQAIDLLLDALVDWGDTILSEMPTWLGAVQAFRNVGANIVSIPGDEDGVDVDALESRSTASTRGSVRSSSTSTPTSRIRLG